MLGRAAELPVLGRLDAGLIVTQASQHPCEAATIIPLL